MVAGSCGAGRQGARTTDTLKDATRILERHIFPELGARPIGELQSHELLGVLKQIELKGLRFTALRAKQRCSRVFRYAVALGYAERDITLSLRGLLEPPGFAIAQGLPTRGVSESS